MTAAERYRALAAECEERARREPDRLVHAEWQIMALAYRRLSEQADRNAQTDVVYEPPPEWHSNQNHVQQQQQQQQQQETDEGAAGK